MLKTALLVDGEWFRRQLDSAFKAASVTPPHGVTADIMYRNALSQLIPGEERLQRFYYYDCPPFEGVAQNPINGETVDFSKSSKTRARRLFMRDMSLLPYVAMRSGDARERGWSLSKNYVTGALKGTHAPVSKDDVYLNLEQKGVDMRIGIDVASLALKRLADRILLISGDTDMIPAVKLARREGLQVGLLRVGTGGLSYHLEREADFVRQLTPLV